VTAEVRYEVKKMSYPRQTDYDSDSSSVVLQRVTTIGPHEAERKTVATFVSTEEALIFVQAIADAVEIKVV
jgi:hypothetical protein